MRPLIIDQFTRDELAKVRAHAERNSIRLEKLKVMIEEGRCIGDDQDFRCMISVGLDPRPFVRSRAQPRLPRMDRPRGGHADGPV